MEQPKPPADTSWLRRTGLPPREPLDRTTVAIVSVIVGIGLSLDVIGLAVWYRLGELITLMTAGH